MVPGGRRGGRLFRGLGGTGMKHRRAGCPSEQRASTMVTRGEDANNGDKVRGGGGRGSCSDIAVDVPGMQKREYRSGGRVSGRLALTDVRLYLPPFRVSSCEQQIPADTCPS